jgi:hypothetical protein
MKGEGGMSQKTHKENGWKPRLIFAGIWLILRYGKFIEKITIFLHQLSAFSGRHLKIKRAQHKDTDCFLDRHV